MICRRARYLTGRPFVAVLMVFFLLISAGVSIAATARGFDPSHRYVVNLDSYERPVVPSRLPRYEVFERYLLYSTIYKEGGKTWYRLRLGFFPTREAAQKIVDSMKEAFPSAWVARVSKKEVEMSRGLAIFPARQAQAKADDASFPATGAGEGERQKGAKGPEAAGQPLTQEEQMALMMDSAEEAMKINDLDRAIVIYEKVLSYPEHRYWQDAQELLGVARERKGETDRAVAEYKVYLALFPRGEGAERVRQRIEVLVTAQAKPMEKLARAREAKKETEVFGSFSQFYYRNENNTDLAGKTISRSSVSTDLDLNVRSRAERYDARAVLNGGYEINLLKDTKNETHLNQLYLDLSSRGRQASGRVGRQSLSTGGVLGRFDGGLFSYQLFKQVRANLVAGYPVQSVVLHSFKTAKYFYGLNFDLGTYAGGWDFNAFIIEQMADGMLDRRATGGEARYFRPNGSFFSLVDYDLSYEVLNTALATGTLTFDDNTTLNLSADYRKSPVLTTTNALQGQTADSLSKLLSTMGTDDVRGLARDRTAISRTYTLGVTRPLNEKFQVSGDVTMSNLSGTPASGGVEAVHETGNEYSYSAQVVGSSLVKEGDTAIIGLRYSDASTADTVSLSLNTRYPVERDFRVNPRLRLDYSKRASNDSKLYKVAPSLRVEYYWKRFLSVELEGAAEWTYEWVGDQKDVIKDYFIVAGYRLDF